MPWQEGDREKEKKMMRQSFLVVLFVTESLIFFVSLKERTRPAYFSLTL